MGKERGSERMKTHTIKLKELKFKLFNKNLSLIGYVDEGGIKRYRIWDFRDKQNQKILDFNTLEEVRIFSKEVLK